MISPRENKLPKLILCDYCYNNIMRIQNILLQGACIKGCNGRYMFTFLMVGGGMITITVILQGCEGNLTLPRVPESVLAGLTSRANSHDIPVK